MKIKSVSEKKKVGVTERPRSLNPSEVIAMAFVLSLFILVLGAHSLHDVACKFARAAVRSKDAQKQLARTSLNDQ